MEKLKYWGTDIWSWLASFFCWFAPDRCHHGSNILSWFTPEHCQHVSNILGMISNFLAILIAVPTLIFITLPKVRSSKAYKKFWGIQK